MKNVVFRDVAPSDASEERIASIIMVNAVNVVPRTLILSTLMMGAIRSSAKWRIIPEDGILHTHRRENLKSNNVGLDHYNRNWLYGRGESAHSLTAATSELCVPGCITKLHIGTCSSWKRNLD
jgi:hypothetical protein